MQSCRHVVGVAVCFLSLVVLGASPALAQLTFGLSAGLNYGSLGDVDFESTNAVYDSRSGWHAGLFLDLAAGVLALRPGVYYINAGSLFEDGLEDVIELSSNFDLTYVAVPVDVRLRMGPRVVKPYIFFGPELRFRQDSNIDDEIDSNIRSFNLSANTGFGVEFNMVGIKVLPEFRFAIDLNGITDETIMVGDTEFVGDAEHMLRAFMLRLGVAF